MVPASGPILDNWTKLETTILAISAKLTAFPAFSYLASMREKKKKKIFVREIPK